jgi:hypothetical protein
MRAKFNALVPAAILKRGVSAMDLQVQEIENEKLEKQKTYLQKQIESLSEKVVLLEKHERKYSILIYGFDNSDQDENIYAVTRHLFTQNLEIDHRKANVIPIAKTNYRAFFYTSGINNWLCLGLTS